jgi:hypothetical protein
LLLHLPDFKKADLRYRYQMKFGRDLIKDIKSDCSGNYETALLALIKPPPQVWAEALKGAMKGIGTSDQLLINFMCIAKDEMARYDSISKPCTPTRRLPNGSKGTAGREIT